MIAPNARLSVNRQCRLLGIARSSFYYQPRPVSAEELIFSIGSTGFSPSIRCTAAGGCKWRWRARGCPSDASASDGPTKARHLTGRSNWCLPRRLPVRADLGKASKRQGRWLATGEAITSGSSFFPPLATILRDQYRFPSCKYNRSIRGTRLMQWASDGPCRPQSVAAPYLCRKPLGNRPFRPAKTAVSTRQNRGVNRHGNGTPYRPPKGTPLFAIC